MRQSLETYFRFDWMLLLAASVLTVIGLLAIYGINISRESADFFQFKKQIVAALFGLFLVFTFVLLDYRQLRSLALPLYGLGAALLVAVLIFGTSIRGTKAWFVIGNISFQPVEIAKISLAIFLAFYLSRYAHKRISWVSFFGSGLATAIYAGLVMLQPDFGSALVMIVIWLAAVSFVGLPRRAWLLICLTSVVGGIFMWTAVLQPYQKDRIISFVQPSGDVRGAGYNVAQARIAIGSGGWFGKGIAEGSQSRLHYLPEASTDFVFSVLGEELGFFGVILVLSLYALLMFRFVKIAEGSCDAFPQILLVCLMAYLMFHLMINVGMNLGLAPVTGIPLPFISAAPSAVIASFITIALAQSIAVRRQPATFR
ncbi:MAG: FtsW/RodA/SpoVE family cell cycle protein [Patescibacteria group bacterium]